MHQIVTFDDAVAPVVVETKTSTDLVRENALQSVGAELSEFFARPVVIGTLTWIPSGVALGTSINPWNLFFTNSRVANRINNYYLMTAKLCVKIVINASPFYYGRLMVDYHPMPGYQNVFTEGYTSTAAKILASQRPRCFINPTSSLPLEMCLPFVWHRDAVTITGSEISSLGTLGFRELAPLKHANGSTQPVTITVMAWAEDVKLAAPTINNASGLVAQSSMEKPGPVQSSAERIRSTASYLSHVPSIGPMATATAGVASAVGSLAKTFGWSKPAIDEPLTGVNLRTVSDLAPADCGDNVSKLTLESKAQVTVDPRIIGLEVDDELVVTSIAARDTWISQAAWTDTNVAGDHLMTIAVRPDIYHNSSGSNIYPACALPTLFTKYWRGTMRYKFVVCASEHHAGRLKVVWDPYIASATPEMNIQRTVIIDISETKEFEVDVEWGQPLTYLSSQNMGIATTSAITSTVQGPNSGLTCNGYLSLYVLNNLALPASLATTVYVQVFVSCPDLEVAVPMDISTVGSRYADQLGTVAQSGPAFLPQLVPCGDGAQLMAGPIAQTHADKCTGCAEVYRSVRKMACLSDANRTFPDFPRYIDHIAACALCNTAIAITAYADASSGEHDFTFLGSLAQSGPESSQESQCDCAPVRYVMQGSKPAPDAALIYFGERILSLRQLLKRYNHHYSLLVHGAASSAVQLHHEATDMPPLPGYRALSVTATTALTSFNYTPQTALTLLPMCFLATRGSLRTKYVASNPNIRLSVTRGTYGVATNGAATAGKSYALTERVNTGAFTTSMWAREQSLLAARLRTGYGTVTSTAPKPVVEVELPYYSNSRFRHARYVETSVGTGGLTDSYHSLDAFWAPPIASGAQVPSMIDRYCAAGEDFQLMWFLGCPPLKAIADPA